MTMEEQLVRLKKDPRFIRPKKKDTKLKVDDRFKDMFEGEDFQTPYKVDKYGRKVVDKTAGADLKRFYRLENEAESEEKKADDEEEVEEDVDEEEKSAETSDSSDSEYEKEPEMLVLEETMAQHPLVNQNVELGDPARRLAIVNLDWDQIKALDILHMLQGFKPPTGIIESVRIYPSEFGKERLEKEAIEGPPKEIFRDANESDESSGDSSSDNEEEVKKPVMIDEGEDFDETQLRKYQLERLRYYYAVVTCDSVETASAIYTQCDGAEFEMSANFLDIRYIPDEVDFSGDVPTDSADHTTKNYRPKTDVITPALQHSKVKLTWDLDDPDRARLTKVNFAKFDYKENDLKAYLASSSDDEESEDEAVAAEKYRKLLLEGSGDVFGRKSHEDNEDLQVTFTTGFDGLQFNDDVDGESEDVHMEATFDASEDEQKEDKANVDETLFEARLRRMRETKKAKKEARLAKIEEVKAAEKAERQAAFKNKKKRSSAAEDPSKADLELLMLEDGPDPTAGRHFDMAEIVKSQKRSKKHGKKETKKVDDGFKLDTQDGRFKAVFEESAYAIDPSHPSYKPTSAMRQLIDERQRRLKH